MSSISAQPCVCVLWLWNTKAHNHSFVFRSWIVQYDQRKSPHFKSSVGSQFHIHHIHCDVPALHRNFEGVIQTMVDDFNHNDMRYSFWRRLIPADHKERQMGCGSSLRLIRVHSPLTALHLITAKVFLAPPHLAITGMDPILLIEF